MSGVPKVQSTLHINVEDYYALLTESLMRMKKMLIITLKMATNILMVPDSVFREESETELTGHNCLTI